MRIRILKVPPHDHVEGLDLRPYDFDEGGVYDVGNLFSGVLMAGGYAAPERREKERTPEPRNITS